MTHLFFLDLHVVCDPVVVCNRSTAKIVVAIAVLIDDARLR